MKDIYSPVIISSVEHHDRVREVKKNNPLWRRIIGFYDVPEGFPHFRFLYKMPIYFFANGKMKLNESIKFKSTPVNHTPVKPENIDHSVNFELDFYDIRYIDRYTDKGHYIKWIRVVSRDLSVLDGDFLMCVVGEGSFSKRYNEETDELYQTLISKGLKPKPDLEI